MGIGNQTGKQVDKKVKGTAKLASPDQTVMDSNGHVSNKS